MVNLPDADSSYGRLTRHLTCSSAAYDVPLHFLNPACTSLWRDAAKVSFDYRLLFFLSILKVVWHLAPQDVGWGCVIRAMVGGGWELEWNGGVLEGWGVGFEGGAFESWNRARYWSVQFVGRRG